MPDKFEIAAKALQFIAADFDKTKTGHRKRLSRERAILLAREACHELGIPFSAKAIENA
jgi:hypothetical protein